MADIGYIETLLTAIKDPNERLNVRRAFENILERINELEAQVADDIQDAIDAIPEEITLPIAHGDIADADALSVFGRAGNTSGEMAPIVAASDHQVFRRSGSALAFGAVALDQAAAISGDLPFANLTQGAALSVLGVAGNATADHASITAGANNYVLRRDGTAIGFGPAYYIQYLHFQSVTVGTPGAQHDPADATNYFTGHGSPGVEATAQRRRIYFPVGGTVVEVRLNTNVAGTLGSAQTSTVNFRLNDTTDTQVSTASSVAARWQTVVNSALSIAVAAGDYAEIKVTTPTWTTNPTNIHYSGYIALKVPVTAA